MGILNGDRVRLVEVKFPVNKGTAFWEFDKCPVSRGALNRGLIVFVEIPQSDTTLVPRLTRVSNVRQSPGTR